ALDGLPNRVQLAGQCVGLTPDRAHDGVAQYILGARGGRRRCRASCGCGRWGGSAPWRDAVGGLAELLGLDPFGVDRLPTSLSRGDLAIGGRVSLLGDGVLLRAVLVGLV